MSVLAIDIGNTRVAFNVFTAGKAQDAAVRITHAELETELAGLLESQWEKARKETEDQGEDRGDEDCEIVIASVVPALTERIKQGVKAGVGAALAEARVRVVGREIRVPLKTALKDEETVGVDRLLGALAAYVNVETACVIVQMGSALVIDCIDDEGVFRGGSIAPGLAMGARALKEFSAKLPLVTLSPPTEEHVFGGDTEEAINLGLYAGARGAVKELIERYATALGSWPHVVATGGDAQAVLGTAELVDSFIPDLVLQGAALSWEHWRKEQ